MLGIELAPVACVGVEFELSCLGGIGDGERECEDTWPDWCCRDDGTMSLGSIFVVGGVDEAGRSRA